MINRRGFFGAMFGASAVAVKPSSPDGPLVVFAPYPTCGRCGDAVLYLEQAIGPHRRARRYRCDVVYEFELPHAVASQKTCEAIADGR